MQSKVAPKERNGAAVRPQGIRRLNQNFINLSPREAACSPAGGTANPDRKSRVFALHWSLPKEERRRAGEKINFGERERAGGDRAKTAGRTMLLRPACRALGGWSAASARRRVVGAGRPRFSTESGRAGGGDDGWSLRARVGAFSVFVAAGSMGTFAYMLATDEKFMFAAKERAPKLVNLFAPYVGLPVDEETGEIDEQAYFPREIGDLVGDSVKVACVLRSGKVVIVETGTEADLNEIDMRLLEKLNVDTLEGDPVVSFRFLDDQEAKVMEGKTPEELQKQFEDPIPDVPEGGNATKQQLQRILQELRKKDLDLRTTIELGRKYGDDVTKAQRTLADVEERKKKVKELIRKS